MELKLKAGQFYGTTSQSLSANGFRFTEKAYSSLARLPVHAHELSHFCFVLAGNYKEKIAGRWFERAPAALVYYPPDVSHGEEHFTSGRHLVEIALAAGFADQTHFTRSFKRVTAMTPSEFRRLFDAR
jgi:AraC-like DNA-binding protein